MIMGTGIDLVELKRIEKILSRQEADFVRRILTPGEQKLIPGVQARKVEFLAGRFAAKEACAKALGTGLGKVLSFQDIQVLRENTGRPILQVSSSVLEAVFGTSACMVHVSISHSKEYAISQVIVEKQ
ncbi:holo-ACP synthase [Aneurinibacillus terranovensis]|uniref:holo-ACP synthase n=1 Tax=Aneurinibacillus terranovensis TaxID=278991 RepID=UPI000427AC32|nr:holo-ACP synthase [Aneurinibacillus terranovensis]